MDSHCARSLVVAPELAPDMQRAEQTSRSIRRRYLVAVWALVAVVVGAHTLMGWTLGERRGDAAHIDLAGRQRMLSQRLPLLAHRYSRSVDDGVRVGTADAFLAAADQLVDHHEQLMVHALSHRDRDRRVWDAMVKANDAFVGLRASIIRIERGMADHGTPQTSDLVALEVASEVFLPAMDAAVAAHTGAAEARVGGARLMLLVLLLVTLAMIGLEMVLLFAPLRRRVVAQMTELERERARADEGARAKARFLATMSHEIRTPLNGVVGLLELMQASGREADRARLLPVLSESSKALTAVLDDVLDFSKFEARGVELEAVPFDLHHLVRGAVRRQGFRAEQRGIACLLDLGFDVPRRVVGDPTRVRQILDNLLSNAVKFTEAGHTMLAVARAPTGIQFTVVDTGVGIDPNTRQQLFDAFSQAERSTTRRFGGTGLGLSIVGRLVEAFGGQITVDGSPGVGSTFQVTLPLDVLASAERTEPEASGLAWVVDPVASRRAITVQRLEELGFDVAHSERLHRRIPFDSVDRLLVNLDGRDFTEANLASWLADKPRAVRDRVVVLASVCHLVETHSPVEAMRRVDLPCTPSELEEALLAERPTRGQLVALPRVERREGGRGGHRVLVVDDVAVNRMVVGGLLGHLGVESLEVDSATAAFEAVRSFAPHVVVMDLQMPGMDGLEATRRLLTREAGRSVPVVVGLTASADSDDHQACRDAGMVDVLTKPVRMETLRERLLPLLSGDGVKRVSAS